MNVMIEEKICFIYFLQCSILNILYYYAFYRFLKFL